MVTISHLVKKELERNPFLSDLLSDGLLNVNALAERLEPAIQSELGKKVKRSAIGMAIRRFSEQNNLLRKKFVLPTGMEVSTKSNVFEVAVEKNPDTPKILQKLYSTLKREKGEFLSVFEGSYELVIFTNQAKKQEVLRANQGNKITCEVNNVCCISVNWPKETKDVPGIYYQITRALAFESIPIQSFHTIGSEMLLVFKKEVFLQAFKAIEKTLGNSSA